MMMASSSSSSPSTAGYVRVNNPDGMKFGNKAKYYGQLKQGTQTPHGRGTMTYSNGGRYEGEWADGKRSGWGTYTCAGGARYEGWWRDGLPHGRGTLWTSDGARCLVADWANGGYPLRGAVMEAGGEVTLATFDGRTPVLLNDGSNWATAAKERTPAGRVVEGGPPAPGGGARAVRVELAGGGAYAGAMRGLAYCGDGVLTDAGGAAWRVTHADGGRTFAEGQRAQRFRMTVTMVG
jgi:hypothetical protein